MALMGYNQEYHHFFIIDRIALAKQGDNVLGSVRPCPSVSVCSHG